MQYCVHFKIVFSYPVFLFLNLFHNIKIIYIYYKIPCSIISVSDGIYYVVYCFFFFKASLTYEISYVNKAEKLLRYTGIQNLHTIHVYNLMVLDTCIHSCYHNHGQGNKNISPLPRVSLNSLFSTPAPASAFCWWKYSIWDLHVMKFLGAEYLIINCKHCGVQQISGTCFSVFFWGGCTPLWSLSTLR